MFSATTSQSGKLKAIFEVLFSNAQTICFTISAEGLFSETTTINNALLKVELPASQFDEYIYTFDEPQYIGVGNHVNQFFKSLKNKTVVKMDIKKPYILDITTSQIGIEDCQTNYSLTLFNSQNVAPMPLESYECEPVLVTPQNFNAMCKSFSKSAYMDVTKKNGQVNFSYEISGISSKTLTFGKETTDVQLFHHQFKSDAFSRIIKLSSFATEQIGIYAESGKPLLIEAKSQLGCIRVYMQFES